MPEAATPAGPIAVIPRPADNLGGTQRDIGGGAGDLQAMLGTLGTTLQPGDTITCPAGAVYNPITLPVRGDSNWICIRPRPADEASLPVNQRVAASGAHMFKVQSLGALAGDGVSPGDSVAVYAPAGSHGWRVIGMEAAHPNANPQGGLGVVYLDTANRLSFERCYVHGHAAQTQMVRCFYVRLCDDFRLMDSCITEAKSTEVEAQGLFLRRTARSHIENCQIEGAGENIILGDQDSAGPCFDTTILRNTFFKPLTWRQFLFNGSANPAYDGNHYTVKNNFEIKWAVRVLFEGNILENNWVQSDQNGTMFLINPAADANAYAVSDVLVQSNIYKNAGYMNSISYNGGLGAARIAFKNNLGLDIGGRALLLLHTSRDVRFEHNTIVPMAGANSEAYAGSPPGAAVFIAWSSGLPDSFPNFTMKANAFGHAEYGVLLQGLGLTTQNLDATIPTRVWAVNAEYDNPSASPVAGLTSYPSAAAAGVNTADGTLASNSPLKVGQAGYPGTDGTDIGVNFSVLDAAQTGTGSAPTIPVANFTYTPTVGSRTVQFTDLSSQTPTAWAYSGPDGFSSASQHPSFTFPTSGDKSITLIATNALGSSAPVTFVITVPALPGFTHAQTTFGAYGGTNQATVPSLTVGHLVVVEVNRAAAASAFTIDSVDDTAGNIYTPRTAVGANHRLFSTVVTVGSASPVVITATISGTTPTSRLIASAWTPLLGPITFDAVVSSSGTGASPMNSGPLVAPAGAALIGYYDYDTVVPTVPAGWTSRAERFVADKLDPVAGTSYSFQPTFTGSQGWYAQLAIFVSGGGGPGPDTVAPTVPTGLDHDVPVATDRVRLTWLPAFDAVGVATYDVRRDAVVIATVATPEYLDTGLQSNTAHSYTVRAGDAVPNYSVYSAAHVVTTGTIESGTHLPPRYMRGFGPVRGTGPTDAIQTPDVGHGVQRSLTFELRLDDFGVLQCVFTKASETVQSLTERVMVTTDGKLHYQRQWSTALGDWTVPVPTLGVRIFVVIRMDTSTPASVPTIKFDNIQQTVTVVTQPTSGAAMQNTAGYLLGNFPGGGGGVLHGDLGRFAVFNFITTDLQDAALFAANDPLGIGVGAVQYIQLDGSSTEPDMVSPFAPSLITDTQTQDYEPPSLVTVVSAGRRMVGWVR